jgi:hypothetical protein
MYFATVMKLGRPSVDYLEGAVSGGLSRVNQSTTPVSSAHPPDRLTPRVRPCCKSAKRTVDGDGSDTIQLTATSEHRRECSLCKVRR